MCFVVRSMFPLRLGRIHLRLPLINSSMIRFDQKNVWRSFFASADRYCPSITCRSVSLQPWKTLVCSTWSRSASLTLTLCLAEQPLGHLLLSSYLSFYLHCISPLHLLFSHVFPVIIGQSDHLHSRLVLRRTVPIHV